MTQLLVRIANAKEAAIAAETGVDIVEMRLGSLRGSDLTAAQAVRSAFQGLLRLSLDGREVTPDLVEGALFVGADELAMTIDTLPMLVIESQRSADIAIVALLAAAPDTAEALQRLPPQAKRIMIESGSATRLFDQAGIADLAALAQRCRTAGLPFGFAGALEAPDIPRLLLLEPDVLGFDTAVRRNHKPDGELLPQLLDSIRALIPRRGGDALEPGGTVVHDTIFVRNFEIALSIGAYRAEERARQRVRFGVEAVVARRAGTPRDMRDIVSYDLILETIRVLTERGHVAFVETLAEEVAASLLAHAAIEIVTVRVEKLDVIDGAVGVAITRRSA